MLRSIRGRLVLSYVLLALLTVSVMGALSLSLVKRYVAQGEVQRLTANAEAVARQAASVVAASRDQPALRQLAHTSAFLGNARIRILDREGGVLADSGPRDGPEGLVWVLPSIAWQSENHGALSEAMETLARHRAFVVLPDVDVLAHAAPDDQALALDLSRLPPEAASTVLRMWEGSGGRRIDYGAPDGPQGHDARTATVVGRTRSERMVTVPIGGSGANLGFVEIGGGPDVVTEALRTARRAIAIAAAGATVLAAAVGLVVSRGLSAPLREVTEAAGLMSGGDLSVRAPMGRRDEIGQLASQFNQMAEKLEGTFAQLASERDALRRFIADASHELRTPITALKSFNSLMRGPAAADLDARDEFLAESAVQIERLEWITRNLLDLSRLEAGLLALETASHDVGEVLTSATSPFWASAQEAGIELSIRPPSQPAALICDRPRLELALGNLLDNALKYTPAGGQIEIGGRRTVNDVEFWVRDTGVGIRAADLPHIFDRFYTGENSEGRGIGLGLAIVQSIIRAHGGRVTVESSPGEGSTFVIEPPQT